MRLFVAVNLPPVERQSIWEATEPLRSAGFPLRPCAGDALHVTLKFLGSVEPDVSKSLAVSLMDAVAGVRTFDLGIGGFGAFPDARDPRVVWLGVEKHPALELLANDVSRAAAAHGFEPELRPFSPHITLARARKDARRSQFTGLEDAIGRLEYSSVMPVESVDLMQSTPGAGGSAYKVLYRAPLNGDAR